MDNHLITGSKLSRQFVEKGSTVLITAEVVDSKKDESGLVWTEASTIWNSSAAVTPCQSQKRLSTLEQ
jgi:hypothetical protein